MAIKRKMWEVVEGGKEQVYLETTASLVKEEINKKFLTDAEKTRVSKSVISAKVNDVAGTIDESGNLAISIAAGVKLTYTAADGVVKLLDGKDAVLSSVDLPLELIVSSGSYNSVTKKIELVLANGNKIEIDAKDLIDEYVADESTLSLAQVNGKSTFKISATYKKKIDDAETAITGIKNGTVVASKSTTADKLSAEKTFAVTGDVTGTVSADLSSGASIATTLANSGVTAGTYSAIKVDAKGRAITGGQIVEFGTATNNIPSADLAVGGIFFELIV